ncbi:Retrovirus-related Pol polyprotein from transposon 17.6, partial [Acipenser ruthenus]
VTFLLHQVGGQGIRTEADKISAVRDWPTPANQRQVRVFLGLASYYHRFVANFADKVAPLNCFLRKGKVFLWGPDCQAAFTELKEALNCTPVVSPSDPGLPFLLDTDASNLALSPPLEWYISWELYGPSWFIPYIY